MGTPDTALAHTLPSPGGSRDCTGTSMLGHCLAVLTSLAWGWHWVWLWF